jgi:hypothetical protein
MLKAKRVGGIAHMVEHLPTKCEILIQTPILPQVLKIKINKKT